MKTYQKVIVSVVSVVACLLLLAGGIAFYIGRQFMPQIEAAQSITPVVDGVYMMTFRGDYGFDGFLENGGASSDAEMAVYIGQFLTHGLMPAPAVDDTHADEGEDPHGCSTIVRRTEKGVLMGRNYDYDHHGRTMITLTYPDNGYASIATNSMDFIGLPSDWTPSENVMERMAAIAAIYVPLDGMNEKGLCVADLIDLDGEPVDQTTDRPDLTTVSAIRLMLDKAATVEEALALLQQYDMHSSIGSAHHFALCDTTGRSVVVEYVDGAMVVNESPYCTNYNLCRAAQGRAFDMDKPGIPSAVERMQTIQCLPAASTIAEGLKAVAFDEWTQWSCIFDTQAQTVNYYFHADFDTAYPVHL